MQGKKLNSRGYTLYDSIFMTLWKRQNYRDREQISGCQKLGWRKDWPPTGHGEFFAGCNWFCMFIEMAATWLYAFVKTLQNYTSNIRILLCVNYTSINLILKSQQYKNIKFSFIPFFLSISKFKSSANSVGSFLSANYVQIWPLLPMLAQATFLFMLDFYTRLLPGPPAVVPTSLFSAQQPEWIS